LAAEVHNLAQRTFLELQVSSRRPSSYHIEAAAETMANRLLPDFTQLAVQENIENTF
jgi:hypothetical protein